MRAPVGKNFTLGTDGKAYIGKVRPTGGGGGTPTPPAGSTTATASGTSADLMAIRPAPGYLKSIHASDLSSLFPPAGWYSGSSGPNSPWLLWCGAVFAPDYSEFGAMVFWGGGHLGYDGIEHYIFDLTTQLWSRLNLSPATNFKPQLSQDWCDAPINGLGYVAPASHTYSNVVCIPPSGGGGAKGSWCLLYNVFAEFEDAGLVAGGYNPHKVDLETGEWSRLTSNAVINLPYSNGQYGSSFLDSTRNVVWGFAGTESGLVAKVDLKTSPKVLTTQNTGGGAPIYATGHYIPEVDRYAQVYIYGDGQKRIDVSVFAPDSNGTFVGFTISQNPNAVGARYAAPQVADYGQPGIGMDYCPDTGKFYCFEGFGYNKLYVLTPPGAKNDTSQWATGVWTWSTETMQGETSVSPLEVQAQAQGAQPLNKWMYHRATKCFMWTGGAAVRNSPDGTARNGAFQLYRPVGT